MTSGTYGQTSFGSSAMQGHELRLSLVSRLRAKKVLPGSILYRLTWKDRITPSLRSISALRAYPLRMRGKGFIGVRSPQATDGDRGGQSQSSNQAILKELRPSGNTVQLMLNHEVHLFGVGTPMASDSEQSSPGVKAHKGRLKNQVTMLMGQPVGAPTPLAGKNSPQQRDDFNPNLAQTVMLMGTATPRTVHRTSVTALSRSDSLSGWSLEQYAELMTGQMPREIEFLDSETRLRLGCTDTIPGENLCGFHAGISLEVTLLTGQLNPRYSGWLMGYPISWDLAAIASVRLSKKLKRERSALKATEMQSSHSSRRSSSKPSGSAAK